MQKFWPEGWLKDQTENVAAQRTPAALAEAMAKKQILEARAAVCDAAHNLIVDLHGVRGIIPREKGALGIAEGTVRDIALISRVNKPVCFVVESLDFDGARPTAILSRRAAQEICLDEYISKLTPGDVIDARVTHLESFGAFCDIGCGIPSLIPIDAISVSRIAHPRDRFAPGDDIRAVVKSVEAGRVALTHKELLGTWNENVSLFKAGETVSGIIRSVEEYGIFVELAPNLAGLAEPHEDVRPGQYASVYIKSTIPEKMKVKLIVIDAFDADYPPAPMEYWFHGNRMEYWRYSPDECIKLIETVF